MKALLTTLAAISLAAGSVFAGCGKVDTTEGTLKSFDAEAKTIVVEGAAKPLTITPSTKGADKVAKLEGKKVKVLSEHGKVTEISKA